ncbi:MAG TPA: hypothetical protein VGK64_20565, partial [Bryobacteraceae bacterium]
ERRLTVGSRPNELEPPARAKEAGEEAGHEVSALILERHRWHRDEDVVRQKGDHFPNFAVSVSSTALTIRQTQKGKQR